MAEWPSWAREHLELHPPDKAWREGGIQAGRLLEAALAAWLVAPVEHVGSTAVPGLPAKPIKFPDASANPYLLIGTAIAAILDGLDTGARAPEPVLADPASLTAPPRALPASIAAAVEALRADHALADALGADRFRSIVQTRLGEAERAQPLMLAEDIDATLWRL